MIRNARVYSTELPDAATLEGHLAELPYAPIQPGELRRHAFVENPITGKLVTRFPNGYAFILRTDERVIPPSIVSRMLSEDVEAQEKATGRKVTKVEKQELREGLIRRLAQTALVRTLLTYAFYDTERQYLIVDAASRKGADPVLQRLVQVMEALQTRTIHVSEISRGLSAKLIEEIDTTDPEVQPFGRFNVGDAVKLKRRGEETETVTYAGVDLVTSQEIRDQLAVGFRVVDMRLALDGFGFKLTEDFALKSFSWPEVEIDEEDDDPVYVWETTSAIELKLIGDVVDALVDLLEYKQPEEEFDLSGDLGTTDGGDS